MYSNYDKTYLSHPPKSQTAYSLKVCWQVLPQGFLEKETFNDVDKIKFLFELPQKKFGYRAKLTHYLETLGSYL